jgi:CHASE2 domain-containing sensor protein
MVACSVPEVCILDVQPRLSVGEPPPAPPERIALVDGDRDADQFLRRAVGRTDDREFEQAEAARSHLGAKSLPG